MSVEDRRNSLRKSSIGIDSIRKSITKLNEGLIAIGNNSRELLKQTRKTNQLKSKLIRQDGEFFKRRRENALRKQREDELEATTITGVTKRQGSLTQKSTRGFLGRILDFVGILILGWALTNLPKIISAFQKLFGFIRRTVGILSGFISGIKNFLVGIGTGIDNFLDIFRRFNFAEDDKNIRDTFESTQNNLTKLSNEFYEGAQAFAKDKDIASAEKVAQDIGVFEANDIPEEKSQQEAKKIEDSGADLLLLECVSSQTAKELASEISIPIIGIGAGSEVDGQILVLYDILGISQGQLPKFSKNYMDGNNTIEDAIKQYIQEVKTLKYPTDKHSFK